jgi:hypothetical protein
MDHQTGAEAMEGPVPGSASGAVGGQGSGLACGLTLCLVRSSSDSIDGVERAALASLVGRLSKWAM